MPKLQEAERTGTEIAGGAQGSRHIITFGRPGLAPRFPDFSPDKGVFFDNSQARKRAWR
jgi:hypothetical protein